MMAAFFSRRDAEVSRRRGAGWWFWVLLLPLVARAHNGDDHGAAPAATAPGARYFTTAATSDNFELVLRYEPLRAGEPATLRLFVADFATNMPIHGAKLTLTTTEAPTVRLIATETAPGDYRLTGTFAVNRATSLAAQVVAPDGRADLLLLRPVEVGKELPGLPIADDARAAGSWLTWRTAAVALGGVLLGVLLTALLLRRRRRTGVSPNPIS